MAQKTRSTPRRRPRPAAAAAPKYTRTSISAPADLIEYAAKLGTHKVHSAKEKKYYDLPDVSLGVRIALEYYRAHFALAEDPQA